MGDVIGIIYLSLLLFFWLFSYVTKRYFTRSALIAWTFAMLLVYSYSFISKWKFSVCSLTFASRIFHVVEELNTVWLFRLVCLFYGIHFCLLVPSFVSLLPCYTDWGDPILCNTYSDYEVVIWGMMIAILVGRIIFADFQIKWLLEEQASRDLTEDIENVDRKIESQNRRIEEKEMLMEEKEMLMEEKEMLAEENKKLMKELEALMEETRAIRRRRVQIPMVHTSKNFGSELEKPRLSDEMIPPPPYDLTSESLEGE